MDLKDAVFEDRKIRRKMSRKEYAALVGITENRVHGLEHGRKVKAGEMEALTPHLGDLLGDDVLPQRAEPAHGHDYGADDYLAERRGLEAEYLNVMNRLTGLPAPPVPWPSQFRIETSPPSDFEAIREWCKRVHAWVDEQGDPEPQPTDGPEYHAEHQYWEERQEPSVEVSDPEVIPEPVTEPRFVTNGELRTFKDCRRKWYLESYRAVGKPGEKLTGAAAVGTRYHQALAEWYQATPGDPWEIFEENTREMVAQVEDGSTMEEFLKDTDLVRAMLEGYFEWVETEGADRGLTVLGSETAVVADPRFPEFPGARLLAKLDVKVWREWDNTVWFIDHKTVPDFTTATRTLHLDEQMLHYHLIERLTLMSYDGVEPPFAAGAMYNMARKVKRSERANPPFYRRDEVRFNRETVQSYWMRTRQTLTEIEATRQALDDGADHRSVAYPHPTRDCSWKCEFFHVCPMFDDGSRAEDFLAEQFVSVNPLRRYEPAFEGRTV